MKKFLKENLVEIIAIIIVIVGAVAFFRRDLASRLINTTLPDLLVELKSLFYQLVQYATEFITRISVYELAVIGLAVAGFLFVIFRIRYRFFRSQRWRLPSCPRCGGELYRVHRTWFDRVLGKTLLPHSRRYLCQNPECRWTGLKGIDRGRRQMHTEPEGFKFDSSD